jgi:hypothetical protein
MFRKTVCVFYFLIIFITALRPVNSETPGSAPLTANTQNYNFLPSIDVNIIYPEGMLGEGDVAKVFQQTFTTLGITATTCCDFNSVKDDNTHFDLALSMPYANVAPNQKLSKYSYIFLQRSTSPLRALDDPIYTKFKCYLMCSDTCQITQKSQFGERKYFYFTTKAAAFDDFDFSKATLMFCGGGYDNRYSKTLSIIEEKNLLNWYGHKDLSTKKSYRGYALSPISDTIKMHRSILTLHSRDHINRGEPTARIFEAAAAGACIISDKHPFTMQHFGDTVLYIDQNDPEEKIAADIERYYTWIINNPEQALALAKKAHQIFINNFTLESQILKTVQIHQEALILDGNKPLPPRGAFSFIFEKTDIKRCNQVLKIIMSQNFSVQNLTGHPLKKFLSASLIKKVAPTDESITASDNMLFKNGNNTAKTVPLAPLLQGQKTQVPNVNLEMCIEETIEINQEKAFAFSENTFLTGLSENEFISSVELIYNLNSPVKLILR